MNSFYTKILTLICSASILCLSSLHAQVSLSTINVPYSENFNTLAISGTTNDITTLPSGWTFLETGTNANTTYAAGTGSSTTGNTYSFGQNASDRSLGGLLSGSLVPTIGASFTNNTGTAINQLHLTYQGEQWRLGTIARGPDRLDFQYSLDASSLNTGSWTDVDMLDFLSPNTTSAVGALNGNDPTNSSQLDFTITGLNIQNGSTFFIRWLDFNVSGSDDGLSIDDFTLIPQGIPADQPAITFVPASVNFGDVQLNNVSTASYVVTGNNLDTIITAYVTNTTLGLSLDNLNFSASIILPDTGATVFVRFIPITSGSVTDSIFHFSGTTFSTVSVTGNGFTQADNIIPISVARTKPVGAIVTVAGRITVANELGNPAYLQDGTGGIPVFDYPLANTVEIGDSVIVTGPIGVFSNQKQISGTGILFTVADSTKKIVIPKPISIAELDANEGLLVTVQNVELIDKSFVFYPQSTEKLTSSGAQIDLRIDGDTDIPGLSKPQGLANITGVVGRFNTNAQLLPRFKADIPGATEPVTAYDSIAKNKTFDVVTWNLEFFGAKKEDYGNQEFGPADEDLQLLNVKKVITALHADIIAVEEVSNDSLFASLITQLDGYAATCSNRYSYSFNGPDNTFPPQKVCFIYDTTTIKILSSRALFESLYDSARTVNPLVLPNYPTGTPSSFWSSGRLPYLVTVQSTINGVTEIINLIDIHAKSGATPADRDRRQYDAQVLKDSLDAHFNNEKIIILGDYNDDLDVSITTGAVTPYANFVSDTSNYIPVTKSLSDAGARSTVGFSDMIDHIVISTDLHNEYMVGSERVFTPFTLIPNYSNTTSDHLAVSARFAFQTPTIHFTEATARVSEHSTEYIVNVVLSKPLSIDYSVSIALSGSATYGQDFQTIPPATNNLLHLHLSPGSTTASFTVSIINDQLDELEENAVFTILPTEGTAVENPSDFVLLIDDNDVTEVSFAEPFTSGEEGSGPHMIKLKLSTPPATDESVTISVYNGLGVTDTDYTTDPMVNEQTINVIVPAGSTQASFSVTPLADFKHELKNESIIFGIQSASSGLKTKNPKSATFTIIDVRNTPPRFFVFPNPTFGIVKIICDQSECADDPVQATLHNGSGKIIYQGTGKLNELSDAISNKLIHERRGLFILQINYNGKTSTFRLLRI